MPTSSATKTPLKIFLPVVPERGPSHLKQGPRATPHRVRQVAGRTREAVFAPRGRGRLAVIGGIEVRWAHWLPGKIAEGTPLTSPLISYQVETFRCTVRTIISWGLGQVFRKGSRWVPCRWSRQSLCRGCRESKRTAILSGPTIQVQSRNYNHHSQSSNEVLVDRVALHVNLVREEKLFLCSLRFSTRGLWIKKIKDGLTGGKVHNSY